MGRFAMEPGLAIYPPGLVSALAEGCGFKRLVIDSQYKLQQNSTVAVKAPAPSLARQDRAP